MHFVRQFTVVVDPHAVGDLWTRKLSSRSSTPNDTDGGAEAAPASEEKAVVVDKYKQLFNAVREAHVFPSSYYQPSVYYSTLTGAAAAEGASVPTASIGSFNFDWWKENEDRDLLVGTLKWGYQNFDQIRMDPDLGFSKWKWTLPTEGGAAAGGKSQPPGGETPRGSSSTPVTEASEAVPQNKAVSAVGDGSSVDVGDDEAKPWPTGTELGVRVRRLIHLYQRQMREEEGGVKSAATMIADGEGGFVIEQDHRWSKRDRAGRSLCHACLAGM